jgi:hypothetical protein
VVEDRESLEFLVIKEVEERWGWRWRLKHLDNMIFSTKKIQMGVLRCRIYGICRDRKVWLVLSLSCCLLQCNQRLIKIPMTRWGMCDFSFLDREQMTDHDANSFNCLTVLP